MNEDEIREERLAKLKELVESGDAQLTETVLKKKPADGNYIAVSGDRYDGGVTAIIYKNGKEVGSVTWDGDHDAKYKGKSYDGAGALSDGLGLPILRVDESSAQEHLSAMFEGETLSEEGKEKIATLFEAAVQYEVEQRTKSLDEQYEEKLAEATKQVEAQVQEQVDAYLSEVVNEWAEINKVEVKNKVKLDLFESFIGGLRTLFIEHNINIPDAQADLAEELMGQIEELQESVASLSRKNIRVAGERDLFARELKFKEVSEGLTDVQAEKLRALIGEGEHESVEKYEAALKTIRESYFKESKVDESEQEEQAPITEEKKPDTTVSIYAEMIAQAMKKSK